MSAVPVKEGRVYINYRDEQDEPEAGSAATPLGTDSAVNITSNMGTEAEIGDNRTRQRSMSDGSGNGFTLNGNLALNFSPTSTLTTPQGTSVIGDGMTESKDAQGSRGNSFTSSEVGGNKPLKALPPTTNTIVASNGEIYSVEPYMMPPPSEIAALFRQNKERAESNLSLHSDEQATAMERQLRSLEQSPHLPSASSRNRKMSGQYSSDVYSNKLKYVGYTQGRSDMFSLRDFTQSFSAAKGARQRGDSVDITDGKSGGMPVPPPIRTSAASNYSSSAQTLESTTNYVKISPSGMNPTATGDVTYAPNGIYGKEVHFGGRDDMFKSATPPSSSNSSTVGSPAHGNVEGLRRRGMGKGGEEDIDLGKEKRIFDIRNHRPRRDRSESLSEQESASNDPETDKKRQRIAFERAKEHDSYFHIEKFDVIRFLASEMFGIGQPSTGEKQGTENIQNFLRVPLLLESLIGFGFLVCFDSFIYVFTYLPLRCLYAVLLLVLDVVADLTSPALRTRLAPVLITSPKRGGPGPLDSVDGRLFTTSHAYDLMRGSIIVLASTALQMLNMSRVYHYIRGQTMIKLYVLTSMLEILDKLLSSFGQDAFDALNWRSRTFHVKRWGDYYQTFFAFVVVATYVVCHSTTYFVHVATLTVAINSNEQALITVLILNNFAEIKGFVFKKFDKTNLFQLACSDIVERFQLVLFLVAILVVACIQAGPDWKQALPDHLFVILLMYSGECLSDWIKHAFISKFNHIDASVYEDFSRVIRKDILSYQKVKEKGVVLDRTYAITRRVGLSQVPLAVVTIRYLNLAWLSPQFQYWFTALPVRTRILGCSGLFLLLVLIKIILSAATFVCTGLVHNRELVKREARAEATGTMKMPSKKSASALSNIERYTMYKGHVIA
jgi:hypothetical protein